MMKLSTYAENTWCPGCGNFGILNAFRRAIESIEKDIPRERIIISAGIGCHGKIFDYIGLSGVYSLHGRAVATVQGIKIANPSLKVVAFVGDGDAMGEGISHLIFAAKRNSDITVIMHNNGVYALTTGQYTPLSPRGFKSKTSPNGNVEEPLNPISLMLESGATFVARAYSGRIEHLSGVIAEAIKHSGFSFVEVLQPCVTFNNTYGYYNSKVEEIKGDMSYEEALSLSRVKDRIPIGIFYRTKKPVFHLSLLGEWNPVEERMDMAEREEKIREVISRM